MTRAMTRLGIVLAALLGWVLPVAAQDIVVTQGSVEIFDNGMFDFGELRPGGLTSKTFTIRNESPFRIDLGGSVTGAGWTGAYNRTVLRAGQRARLVITLDRASSGDKSAIVSITDSNVGGEIFAFTVKAKVLETAPAIRLTQGRTLLHDNDFVSFGRIPEEGSSTRVFNLRNTGTATLNLGNFLVSGNGFQLVRSPSGSLKPGATTRFTVRMNGGNAGARAGTLSFQPNIPADPQFLIELGGTVGEALPAVQLSQSGVLLQTGDTFSFEETVTGATLPKRFRIRNNGGGPLSLTSIETSDPQFIVDGLTTTSVGAGQATDFFLVYRPTAEGDTVGTLNVNTNDPIRPALAVNLTGVAGPPPEIRVYADGVEFESGSTVILPETDTDEAMEIITPFEIQNIGEGPLSVTFVSIGDEGGGAGNPKFFLNSGGQPTELPQGGSTTFTIGFGPPKDLAVAVYSARLVILNSDPDESDFSARIIQEVLMPAMGPGLRSSGSFVLTDAAGDQVHEGGSVDFGAGAGDHAVVRSFTITNTTGAPLRSGKASVAGVGFSVASQPRASLEPGESTTFEVAFDASSPGRYAAAVTVAYSGARAGQPFVFAVAAESAR